MYPGSVKPMAGQTLPTIKSENTTSPAMSTPATTVKVAEGVALPSADASDPASGNATMTNGKATGFKNDQD
jgi:hypothetical protein